MQEKISALLDGELGAADTRQLRGHLDDCADCRMALEAMTALRGSIATQATVHTAPPHLRQRIHAALQAQAPRAATAKRRYATWPWAWLNLGLAGVATAAFAVTLGLYLHQPSADELTEQELVASHFRALMPNHLADVASTDQHTVKPWFAGKLDFSPPVYDLALHGYALVGGRLDYVQQRPVAALVYQHRKHIMNVYVWPDRTHQAQAPRASERQGFHVLRWTQDGMVFSAVSDMGAPELAYFAEQLRAKVGSAEAQ